MESKYKTHSIAETLI